MFWGSKEMAGLMKQYVQVGKWTYQTGPQDLLLVWMALVSPWMCAQQTWSGNFRRNRIRSDSLVSMAKSEHHKAGIKQDGMCSQTRGGVHGRSRQWIIRDRNQTRARVLTLLVSQSDFRLTLKTVSRMFKICFNHQYLKGSNQDLLVFQLKIFHIWK